MEAKTVTTNIVERNLVGRISRHVQFTLCGSCFWCASYLDGRGLEKCPYCESDKVESMPVAGNEMFTFDYGTLRGVTVRFVPSKSLA